MGKGGKEHHFQPSRYISLLGVGRSTLSHCPFLSTRVQILHMLL